MIAKPYWLIVDYSTDGRTWKRLFNGPATGAEAGTFLSLAPTPHPFVQETWYKRTSSGWIKQGSTNNWS